MQRPIWIFGGVAGLLSALLEYAFFSGQGINSKTLYLAQIAVLAICVIFGLILLRKLRGGTISIGRTLLSGLLIGVVKSVVATVFYLVLYVPDGAFFEPHRIKALDDTEIMVMENEDIEPEDKQESIDRMQERVDYSFQPGGYAIINLFGSLVTAFVVSILAAAFISTNMMYKEE